MDTRFNVNTSNIIHCLSGPGGWLTCILTWGVIFVSEPSCQYQLSDNNEHLIPKMVMLTLRVHCEPLKSNWSKKCECVVEFLFFSYKRLCTVTFGIR